MLDLRDLGFRKFALKLGLVILGVIRMRKVLMVFLVIVVTFIACGDGNTERTRCASDARDSGALDPETCAVTLGIAYGDPIYNKLMIDFTILGCLNYNLALYKCEKKSNILPP